MGNTSRTASTTTPSTGRGWRDLTPLARSWVSVALVPAFLILSFAAQEVIYAVMGQDPGSGTVPLWASLAAGLPGLAILLIPCTAGVLYARRAVRAGVGKGWVPGVLAALLGAGAVVLTLANL